jgi:methyl-accepting chemotaxis protein
LVQSFKRAYPTENFLEKARKEIVDIAGRQRMLTQKMTKEKLLTLLNVDAKENEKKMVATIELFERSLHDLRYGNKDRKIVKPTNKELIEQLNKVATIWKHLKPLYFLEQLDGQKMKILIKGNLVLLNEMDRAVFLSETVAEY